MKVGYTEFSFGYAFTENLIRSSATAPSGAPVFPNLVQEGASGFDIRINFPGAPLFFQYKLPELMKRGTAYEMASGQCPNLTTPFFRIAMMRRDISRQHELLIALESRYPSSVFYAAPALESLAAFNRAYNNASVAQRSVFFSPTDIGPLPDDKAHTIAYRSDIATAYFFSEPKSIKALTFSLLSSLLISTLHEERFRQVQLAAREIRESVLRIASPTMQQAEQQIEEHVRTRRRLAVTESPSSSANEQAFIDVSVAREVARIDMGIDLLLVQSR